MRSPTRSSATLGTPGGPLQVVTDDLTVSDEPTRDYAYEYNVNGGVDSMLAEPGRAAQRDERVGPRVHAGR